jgi:hypothetical protein
LAPFESTQDVITHQPTAAMCYTYLGDFIFPYPGCKHRALTSKLLLAGPTQISPGRAPYSSLSNQFNFIELDASFQQFSTSNQVIFEPLHNNSQKFLRRLISASPMVLPFKPCIDQPGIITWWIQTSNCRSPRWLSTMALFVKRVTRAALLQVLCRQTAISQDHHFAGQLFAGCRRGIKRSTGHVSFH